MKRQKDKPFSRLSKADKRVAIARDVIKQIKAEKYAIQTGIWTEINVETMGEEDNVELDKKALLHGLPPAQRTINCTCCAVGAAFLSSIRLFNVATVTEGHSEQEDSFDQLQKYFSKDQLDMIEESFELGSGACSTETETATEFGRNYADETDRALAIFRNIVRNKGEFKP